LERNAKTREWAREKIVRVPLGSVMMHMLAALCSETDRVFCKGARTEMETRKTVSVVM
jgi:hypothetical protein